jgi:integrase
MSNNQTNFSEKVTDGDDFGTSWLKRTVEEDTIEPYTIFNYSIRSAQTKDTYFRRLRTFFQYSEIGGETFRDKCNYFAIKGKTNPNWAFKLILNFIQYQRSRVIDKEIKSGTLRNYQKTLKSFCEATDILIPWKKITKGLPKGKRYSDDRSPTIEEICLIANYPDRRIKSIVYVMSSSGIRVGAWDYLKWGHVKPIVDKNDEQTIVAAKLRVYAGEDDEYFTFITPEAYNELNNWMNFRKISGENVTNDSWVMRNLWNTEKIKRKCSVNLKNDVSNPKKLTSIGIKRLMERALWTQNLRTKNNPSDKRYEFQTDHGFRKFFKTRCELGGMKPINIEKFMGHSTGISDSYYKATEEELLQDYLSHIEHLLINNENKISMQLDKLSKEKEEQMNINRSELQSKETKISELKERILIDNDSMITLSDRIIEITRELEYIKRHLKPAEKPYDIVP